MTLRVLRDEPLRSRTFAEDPGLRTAFPRLAYYASMWSYYEAATNTTPEDLSFVEVDGNGLPAFGFLGGSDSSGVSFFGTPAIAEFADSSPGTRRDRLGGEIAEEVTRDLNEVGSSRLTVRLLSTSSVLTGFDQVLLSAGARTQLQFSAEADLTFSEENIWSSLRPRYRSFINRGRKAFEVDIVNAERPEKSVFDSYRALHLEVSGRQTRPDRSWDEMYRRLEQDEALLLVARLENRPVAATFVTKFGGLAVYASGAYVRDLGNFPVSHWPMYASMLAAKQAGCSRFVIGAGYFDRSVEVPEKLQSIANFKRGFATEIIMHRQYVLESSRSGDGGEKNGEE